MSQNVFDTINPDLVGGTELAEILNDFKNALMSNLLGPTRPESITAGGSWIDSSVPGELIFKFFTGSADIVAFSLNLVTGKVSLEGSEDFFEIARVSADAIGPRLLLYKARGAVDGALAGDTLGEITVRAKDSLGADRDIGRIRYVVAEDVTDSNSGAGYWAFEGTLSGSNIISEFARVVGGRLGIGVTSPTHTLHLRGNGAKAERVSNDNLGVRVIRKKARTTNQGQILNGDEISTDDFISTDNTGAEALVGRLRVVATQAHTDTARGVALTLSLTSKDAASVADVLEVKDGVITMKAATSVSAFERQVQYFPSAAEVKDLDAAKSFIEVTGNTSMILKGVKATSKSRSFYLYNATTENIIIENRSPDVPGADQIAVNGEVSFVLQPGKSTEFVRRDSINKWSPLIEGTTGITFNEARDLLAKQVISQARYMPLNSLTPLSGSLNHQDIITHSEGSEDYNLITGTSNLNTKFFVGQVGVGATSGLPRAAYWEFTGVPMVLAMTAKVMSGPNVKLLSVSPLGTPRSALYDVIIFSGTINNVVKAASHNAIGVGNWNSVTGFGEKVAVTAGSQVQKLAIYDAPTNAWSYVTADMNIRDTLSSAFGAGKLVVTGFAGPGGKACWVSSDQGVTWTGVDLPNQETYTYNHVTFQNGYFIATGYDATGTIIVTSSDGLAWNTRLSRPATAGSGNPITSITYCGGLYVAALSGSSKHRVIYSFNLAAWQEDSSVILPCNRWKRVGAELWGLPLGSQDKDGLFTLPINMG